MIAPDAPTLTAKSDHGQGVEVLFPSLDVAADKITVWRVADGGREEVQGAKLETVSGDFVVTDWSVPFGVPSTYVGEIFDSAGASIVGGSSVIQVDSDEVRVSNPIDPEQTFTIELQATSLQGVERGTNNQKVYVVGVPRPFNQFWGEGSLQNIPLEVWSRNESETANLMSLTSAGQWLIRTPPKFVTLPRLLYVSLQPPRHGYQAIWDPDNPIVWTLTVDEVQPISKAIIRPLITWDDWEAAFPGETVVSRWNVLPNPSGRVSLAGYGSASGSLQRDPGTSTYLSMTPAAPGVAYISIATLTVGDSLTAGAVYKFSAGIFGSATSVSIFASVGPQSAPVPAGGGFTRASVDFTAPTSGTVTFYVLNSSAAVAGNNIAFQDASVELASTYAGYFDGSTPASGGFTYAWTGAPNGSLSVQQRVDGFTWDEVMAVYGAGTWTDAVRNPPNA